jgi:hypothetical protein
LTLVSQKFVLGAGGDGHEIALGHLPGLAGRISLSGAMTNVGIWSVSGCVSSPILGVPTGLDGR